MSIDKDSPAGAWEDAIKSTPRRPQTVDTLRGYINLGKLQEDGTFDLISARFFELSIPPGATVEEVEALLSSSVRVALAQCRKEAFPHGQAS